MRASRVAVFAALSLSAAFAVSCGGGGGGETPNQETVSSYLQELPAWQQYSPPAPPVPPTKVGDSTQTTERIDNVPVADPVTNEIVGYRSEQYACTTTRFTMTDTPEKIVMFSPDRELLWPGALIQGRSHRDGIGSLLPLTIRERTPIKVSIPSLATVDNFRVVDTPDQAEVNQAIGSMIGDATAARLATPSTIQFTMRDYSSDESFALQGSMSGRYMGFRASASASVSRSANERTVMVYFFEKMFEAVVEPPQTPGAFFSDDFTQARLNEQVAMGRIGPANPPLYVSNIVYGRTMAFTFTSTASSSEIKAALNAAYRGIFSVSASLSDDHRKILSEAKIAITSLGGTSSATVAMIASGDWRQYFSENPPLTSAYPLSYTFRNLGDGSIARVSESTAYDIKECSLKETAFSGFVLDSFETENAFNSWSTGGTASQPSPVGLTWGAPTTPQSIFYGYVHARHTNALTNDLFKYDVGYLRAPGHFTGDKSDFYKGELSFWFRPDERVYSNAGSPQYCYWVLFPFVYRCVQVPVNLEETIDASYKVHAYDSVTTFDQVVLRGGTPPVAVLTLTYNPRDELIGPAWQRHVIGLTNDTSSSSLCNQDKKGCWLVEDEVATEDQIKYVLANITDFRIRASYPVTRQRCGDDPPPAPGAACQAFVDEPFPFGYVGGYFDEVQISKRSPGL